MATVLGHDERGRGLIELYMDALRAELAFFGIRGRRSGRICEEARVHLLELALEHGEEEAVERFGSPRELAVEAARVAHPIRLLRLTLVYAAVVALFVVPLYVIPENTLPPAPWIERPGYLTWKLYLADAAFVVALLTGLVAVLAAWRRFTRVAFVALVVSGVSLALSAIVWAIASVQWADAAQPQKHVCGGESARIACQRFVVPGGSTTMLVGTLLAMGLLLCLAAGALASTDRVRRFARELPR